MVSKNIFFNFNILKIILINSSKLFYPKLNLLKLFVFLLEFPLTDPRCSNIVQCVTHVKVSINHQIESFILPQLLASWVLGRFSYLIALFQMIQKYIYNSPKKSQWNRNLRTETILESTNFNGLSKEVWKCSIILIIKSSWNVEVVCDCLPKFGWY